MHYLNQIGDKLVVRTSGIRLFVDLPSFPSTVLYAQYVSDQTFYLSTHPGRKHTSVTSMTNINR